MPHFQRIAPCLWFDDRAEEAARFYAAIFKNSRIVRVTRYGEAGREIHGKPPGTVMTVAFALDGQAFTALNGGPVFKFNEAISFLVQCDTHADQRAALQKLRKTIKATAPAAEECISYGLAANRLDGKPLPAALVRKLVRARITENEAKEKS